MSCIHAIVINALFILHYRFTAEVKKKEKRIKKSFKRSDDESEDDVPLSRKGGDKNGKKSRKSDYDLFMNQGVKKGAAKSDEESDEDVPLAKKRRPKRRGKGSKSDEESSEDKPGMQFN